MDSVVVAGAGLAEVDPIEFVAGSVASVGVAASDAVEAAASVVIVGAVASVGSVSVEADFGAPVVLVVVARSGFVQLALVMTEPVAGSSSVAIGQVATFPP